MVCPNKPYNFELNRMQSQPSKEPPPPYSMGNAPPYSMGNAPPYAMGNAPPHKMMNTMLGPQPQSMQCPYCHAYMVTRTQAYITTKTHLIALLICFLCCCCFWIPYVTRSCQSINHYCSRCNGYIGRYDN